MSLLIENLKKSYREPGGGRIPVLNVPRFELQSAEQVALVGTSGGGKTTLLNVISGITTPDSGRVVIDGVDITSLNEPSRDRFRAPLGFEVAMGGDPAIFEHQHFLAALLDVAQQVRGEDHPHLARLDARQLRLL